MKSTIINKNTNIKNLIIIKPESFYDYRGENIQTYDDTEYSQLLENIKFTTDSYSFSTKNVLRGFHGDTQSSKLIQCLRGTVFFSVIDMRPESETYHNVFTCTLNDKNRWQILVPSGCVNAHLCISDDCIFSYKLSHGYVPIKNQLHVYWSDTRFLHKINWPTSHVPIVSARDNPFQHS
jgi:dTDP-4-dehydrorhamnose 3,5-epimerase